MHRVAPSTQVWNCVGALGGPSATLQLRRSAGRRVRRSVVASHRRAPVPIVAASRIVRGDALRYLRDHRLRRRRRRLHAPGTHQDQPERVDQELAWSPPALVDGGRPLSAGAARRPIGRGRRADRSVRVDVPRGRVFLSRAAWPITTSSGDRAHLRRSARSPSSNRAGAAGNRGSGGRRAGPCPHPPSMA